MALNKLQQDLVEQNHNLIYDFAKKKNLDIEDYYDILAIGLCKAASAYQKDKAEFSTFAFCCMNNELNNYWSSISTLKTIPEENIVSYDTPKETDNDDSMTYLDTFASAVEIFDEVLFNIQYEDMMKQLNPTEKIVVKGLCDGMTVVSIAKQIGCAEGKVRYIRNKLRKRLSDIWK